MKLIGLLLAAAFLVCGFLLCYKPSKNEKVTDNNTDEEDESEVMKAEVPGPVDETQDGRDPSDGIELAEEEISMIDTDTEPYELLKNDESYAKQLQELGYKIGAQEEEHLDKKEENVVSDTEDDGRKYYRAPEHGSQDPFDYQRHNI